MPNTDVTVALSIEGQIQWTLGEFLPGIGQLCFVENPFKIGLIVSTI